MFKRPTLIATTRGWTCNKGCWD